MDFLFIGDKKIAERKSSDSIWTFYKRVPEHKVIRDIVMNADEYPTDLELYKIPTIHMIHNACVHAKRYSKGIVIHSTNPPRSRITYPTNIPGHPMYKVTKDQRTLFTSPDIQECREWAQENDGGKISIAPIAVLPPIEDDLGAIWVYVYARKFIDKHHGPFYFRYGRAHHFEHNGRDVWEFLVRSFSASLVPWKERRKKKRYISISGIRKDDGPGYENHDCLSPQQLICIGWFLKMSERIKKRIMENPSMTYKTVIRVY